MATSFVLSRPVKKRVNTKLLGEIDLPETNSEFTVLKIDGWKTSFILGRLGLFSGAFAVSFREIYFPQFLQKEGFMKRILQGSEATVIVLELLISESLHLIQRKVVVEHHVILSIPFDFCLSVFFG